MMPGMRGAGVRSRSRERRADGLHERAGVAGVLKGGPQPVAEAKRGVEIPHGAEDAVPQTVHALRNRTRPLIAPSGDAQPLESGHVHPATGPDERLDDSVITAGREDRGALADHGRVAAT
jgi:hypothetical protein